jgi:UDP-N-acetylmuramate--alanine ligase
MLAPSKSDFTGGGDGVDDWRDRRLHFVGVGGCGMSGLALVARSLGATVSGSDCADQPVLARLRAAGVSTHVGHAADQVPAGVELIYSTAILPDNPERRRAEELGLPVRRRGELLAELARPRRTIAVAGSHGKTTTAAMTVTALRGAGIPAGYIIGADLLDTGVNADWGSGDWLVVEADESDRSLLALSPEVAVLTNVELEHVRIYRSWEDVAEVFRQFLAQAEHNVIWDRPELLALSGRPDPRRFDAPHPRLAPQGSRFDWREHEVSLPIPGEHNARNAAAALEASRLAGAAPDRAVAALAGFGGTARRLERVGRTASGAEVYDDYAHHPTEVSATLAAARTLGPSRLVAVFEPHSFQRTRLMAEEFGRALTLADESLVLDVLRAGPLDVEPVSSEVVVQAARSAGAGAVHAVSGHPAAEQWLRARLRPGDLCVTMGNLHIDELAHRLCEPAAESRAAARGRR